MSIRRHQLFYLALLTAFRPNRSKPRSVYRPDIDLDPNSKQSPVAIHASVVDFLQSQEHSQNKKKEEYIPRAIWCGYKEKPLPWIEDGTGRLDPESKAAEAILMDWKLKETWGQSMKRKIKALA